MLQDGTQKMLGWGPQTSTIMLGTWLEKECIWGYLSGHELSKARGEGQSGDKQGHQGREEQASKDGVSQHQTQALPPRDW